jgi:hypothetical protein
MTYTVNIIPDWSLRSSKFSNGAKRFAREGEEPNTMRAKETKSPALAGVVSVIAKAVGGSRRLSDLVFIRWGS